MGGFLFGDVILDGNRSGPGVFCLCAAAAAAKSANGVMLSMAPCTQACQHR